MATFDDMCENVRLRMGDPRAQAPNDQAILNQVCSQVRNLKRFKRVTGNVWDFNDLIVQVQPNIDTYTINQSDFGQALAVITYDPTNPIWIPRMIKIYEPQNLVFDIPALPQNQAAWSYLPYDNSKCTAQRVAFYWRDNQPYIQFWPLPLLAAQYRVRYIQNAGAVASMPLSQEPLPSEESDLVEIRSSISLLGMAEWKAPDSTDGRAVNAEKRKDLAVTLANDEREAARLFEAIVRQPHGPHTYQRWNPTVC